mgnify:CR=1 FL=1
MKTSFKIGVLAAAFMFSISSCSSCGNKDKNTEDSKIDTGKTIVTPQKTIDTAKKAGPDTTKKDTIKK